jgi:hypothetical protein
MTREQRIEAVLDRFGKYVVQQARANLTRKNKNVSKDLYNSIKWEAREAVRSKAGYLIQSTSG